MIECKPLRICSWNYILTGDNVTAMLKIFPFGETGSLNINGKRYSIEKKDPFNSEWALCRGSDIIATASEKSSYPRSFEIECNSCKYRLEAVSTSSRHMHLEGDGHNVVYSPKHSLSRKAEINGPWKNKEVLLFGFYLTVLMWKHSANDSNTVTAAAC